MKYAVIIRYCEIHLKGKNRGFFEKLLEKNIEKSLAGIKHTFKPMHSRYLIEDFAEEDYRLISEKLHKVAGVHTFSRAIVVSNDLTRIIEAAKELLKGKSGTFKVETNRADKTFSPNSVETSAIVGGKLLEFFGDSLKVSVKNADFTVNIDIRVLLDAVHDHLTRQHKMLRADFREFHEQVATDFVRYVSPFKHMRYRNHFSFSIVCLIQITQKYE